jgi:uncharacterized protein (TIGR04255 family)
VPAQSELEEIFPSPPVREVAFEIRFSPRLRIVPEVWRIQDRLSELYPQIGEENTPQPDGRVVRTYVFANPADRRLVKVSQENFVIVFNAYSNFEDFKAEVISRTADFSREFEVRTYQRVGLRYVNHIEVSAGGGIHQLRRYLNIPIDFERFDPDSVEQFLSEFRLGVGSHKLTVRGAMIPVPASSQQLLYILDLDCYSVGHFESASLPALLDEFHHEIQVQFLMHTREEYKALMRRRT